MPLSNRNSERWGSRACPCGTTLATAFGSDLRSVDTLRGSRFALRQPDDFVAGESRGSSLRSSGDMRPRFVVVVVESELENRGCGMVVSESLLDSTRRMVESWMFAKRGIVRLAAEGRLWIG